MPVAPFGLGHLPKGSDIMAELIARTDPFIEAGVPGSVFFGADCQISTEVNGDTTTITYATPRGELTQKHRSTGVTSACVEFPVKTPEDAERFLSIGYAAPRVDVSGFLARKQEIGEDGLVLCCIPDAVCLPASLLSPGDFCFWWADYPDLMTEITNVGARRVNDWVDRLGKAGVDAFRIVGGEYASVQLGPAGFDALVLRQDMELVRIIHSHDGIAYYHNHGPVMAYASRFAEIGMDALDPLEAPPWGDADLRKARRACGNKVAFVGNLDDMEVIDKLPAASVVAIALERLDAAGDRGFILGGTASGTYTEAAARNFIAIVDALEGRNA